MAVPGVEPGSSGSQPLMLTTTPYDLDGGVAHSVERSVRNRQAQGSKPCSSTFFFVFVFVKRIGAEV